MSAQVGLDFLDEMDRAEPIMTRNWLNTIPSVASAKLRDMQLALLSKTADAMQQHRRILIQAPTSFGKTHCMSALIAAAEQADLRVLVLATRTRLIRQIHERLEEFSIRHGILAAGMPGYLNWSHPVQLASIDTLYRRCIVDEKTPLPLADVVLFDESHLALGASRRVVLDNYPTAWHFGLTATPAKTSGASLSQQFDALILGPTPNELITAGSLVKVRVFGTPVVSEKELKSIGTNSATGDYKTGNLSALMSKPKLVGDVVQNWLRIANGKRTLVFACDKAHGACLLEEFRQAGVAAEQLTDDDNEATREEAILRLERGHTLVLVNCFLLSYGVDIPRVEVVVMARPTKSLVLYLQSVGRGIRPFPGKNEMLFIDHGRVVDHLGMPTMDRHWSLSGDNANQQAKQITERLKKDQQQRTCKDCMTMWLVSEDGPRCPMCGWQPIVKPRGIATEDADLSETGRDDLSPEKMREFFAMSCQWYATRWPDRWLQKSSSGRWWAWVQTKTRFRLPENTPIPKIYWHLEIQIPTDEVSGWLKSQQIRWAKFKAKRGRQIQ